MNKAKVITVLLSVVFFASFSIFLYDSFSGQITGRQVYLDEDFERDISDFGPGEQRVIQDDVALSPTGCELKLISSNITKTTLDENITVYVDGLSCIGESIEATIFEKDYIFDDHVAVVFGTFIKNRVALNWEGGEEFAILFNDFFEGEDLEIYFKVDYNGMELISPQIEVAENLEFSPPDNSRISAAFLIVLGIIVLGILIVGILLIRSIRLHSRF